MALKRIALGLCVLVMCAACKKPPRKFPMEKDYSKPLPPGQMALRKITDPAKIPDFSGALNDPASLMIAIDHSLDYFQHPSSQKYFPYLDISHGRAVRSLIEFKKIFQQAKTGEELQQLIVSGFDVYESVGCDDVGTVLFTGYFTPIYEGSLKQTPEYRFPLYKTPPDLVKDPETGECLGRKTPEGSTVPSYYTREEIDGKGVLKGKGLELVWLKSKIEAYIIHVQGSARIRLPDGKEICVGYTATNGKEYESVGMALINDGKITAGELSLKRLRQFFADNPDQLDAYLYKNQRYVFFGEAAGGPYGSLGQPVTAYRSIATDKAVFPRGCIAFINTMLPTVTSDGRVADVRCTAFMLDQDTGGAIRSAGRTDIYMGLGDKAEILAGRVKNEGRLYYIFVKETPVSMALEPYRSY